MRVIRERWVILAAFLTLATIPNARAETTVRAMRAKLPPVVDGRLNEKAWRQARPVARFAVQNSTKPAAFKTTAYLLYDDAKLYIGFKCDEPDVKSLVAKPVPHDNSDVYRGDCVEIMLDPLQSKNDYFHFAVNVSGSRYERSVTQSGHVGDVHWNGRWQAKTFVGKDFWSCEVAIPFYTLGITPQVGATWRINLCREKKKPHAENSSIAEQGAFNIAGRFAMLSGLNVDFSNYCYRIGTPVASTKVVAGKLNLTLAVSVKNETGRAKAAALECIFFDPKRKLYVQSSDVQLAAGKAVTHALEPLALTAQGEYEVLVRIVDPETKKTLAMKPSRLKVAYVPMTIRLIEPWYRDCIFETQKLKQVVADVDIRLEQERLAGVVLETVIRKKAAGDAIISKTITHPRTRNRVQFDVDRLPYGKLVIAARLKDRAGKVLEETTQRLWKLPYKKGEAWPGKDRVWRVDGKPFFINGGWCRERDRNPYFNTYTSSSSESVKRVWCFWSPKNLRAEFRNDTLSEKFQNYIREKTEEAAGDPNLLILFLDDEPECSAFSPKGLKVAYDIMRDVDPYHPVMIANDSLTGLKEYAEVYEINGLHPYPPIFKDKRINDFEELVVYMDAWDRLYKEGRIGQTIAFMHQGFNYGDYGAVNNRVPNYVELRSQNLLAVILGATGFMQFNRSVDQYPELYIGIPHLTRELAYLGRAVVAPTSKLPVKVSHKKARALLKEVEGELFLFVCNADMTPRNLTVTVPGLARRAKRLQVISEARSVTVQGDSVTDAFDTFEVHVYTTSREKADLPTVKAIKEEIARANRARRKPGNLVFQEYERDGVIIRASTNTAGKFRRPDNGLWHVVDGVVTTFDHYKSLTWHDATPNQYPDWLEIQMPKPHNVGRVVVYPFEKSLKSYSVQAFVNGQWKDVDRVAGKRMDSITHRFKPVKTERIRLWITATNTPLSQVAEIEIYEK